MNNPPASAETHGVLGTSHPLSILIVSEDRELAREKFQFLIKDRFPRTRIAAFSEDIAEEIGASPPDLIFLDAPPGSPVEADLEALLQQKYHIPAVKLFTSPPYLTETSTEPTGSYAYFSGSEAGNASLFVELSLIHSLRTTQQSGNDNFPIPTWPVADINLHINFQGDVLSLHPAPGNVDYFSEGDLVPDLDGLIHQDDVASVREILGEVVKDKNAAQRCRFRAKTRTGSFRYLDAYASILTPDSGDAVIALECYDLTRTDHPLNFFPLFDSDPGRWIDALIIPIFVCDLPLNLKFVNKSWMDFTGKTLGEEFGAGWKSDIHPEDLEKFQYLFDRAVARKQDLKTEIRMFRKDGEVRWMLVAGRTRCDEHQTPVEFIGACIDITEYKNIEESLYYLASHDSLTGLYNRAFFEEEMIRFEKSSRFPISIVVADVDGMKLANDSLGHRAGDELLRRSARVLFETFRSEDIVARIGGDEFAILLPDTEEQVALEAIDRVRGSLRSQVSEYPDFPLRLSMGAATAGQDLPLNEALILADRRMYNDKLLKR